MTSLSQAETLADQIEYTKQQFDAYMRPILQDYIDFLPELGSGYAMYKPHTADDFHFTEIDYSGNKYFEFHTEEFRHYGDEVTDSIDLPFDFVEDPEAYKARIRKANAEREANKSKRKREETLARVLKARLDLEKAEKAYNDL